MDGIIRQNDLRNCSTKSKLVKVLEIHLTLNYTKSPLLRVRKKSIINEHYHLVGHPEIKLCYAKIHEISPLLISSLEWLLHNHFHLIFHVSTGLICGSGSWLISSLEWLFHNHFHLFSNKNKQKKIIITIIKKPWLPISVGSEALQLCLLCPMPTLIPPSTTTFMLKSPTSCIEYLEKEYVKNLIVSILIIVNLDNYFCALKTI